MAKIFNRTPVNFGRPAQNADNIKHHNTFKFKGVIDDKNFLNVDQDSFADSLNVYVDSEEVLRSRPSLKEQKIIIKLETGEVVLSNIVNVKSFSDVIVYESENDGKYYLTFVNEDFEEHLQVECEQNVKLVLADKKIFVFAENSLNYYDMDSNKYFDAEKFIYKPVTKYFVDGLETSEKGESKNILTNTDIYSYIFTNVINGDFSNVIGKEVKIELNDVSYKLVFTDNKNYVFVDKFTFSNKLTNDTYGDDADNPNVFGINARHQLMLSISDYETYIATEYDLISDTENGYLKEYNFHYFYSSDGLLYTKLPDLENAIGDAKISHNGLYAVVMTNKAPYIISLLTYDGSALKYPVWTNLFAVLNETRTFDFNSGVVKDTFLKVNMTHNTVLNIDVVDDRNFVIVYGKTPIENLSLYEKLFYGYAYEYAQYKTYSDLDCVYCINGIITIKNITKTYATEMTVKNNYNRDSFLQYEGSKAKNRGTLKVYDCQISSLDGQSAVVRFNWIFMNGYNETLQSGTFEDTLYNTNDNNLDTYKDVQVNGGYGTTPLFRVKVNFATNINDYSITITGGYYLYENNNEKILITALTCDNDYREYQAVYNGFKPNVKMTMYGSKFAILCSVYAIDTYYGEIKKLYFKIFDNHYEVKTLPSSKNDLWIDTYNCITIRCYSVRCPLHDGLYLDIYENEGKHYCTMNIIGYSGTFDAFFLMSYTIEELSNGVTYNQYYAEKYKNMFSDDKSDRFLFSSNADYILSKNHLYKVQYTFDVNNPTSYKINLLLKIALLEESYPLRIVEKNNLLLSISNYKVNEQNIATIYKTPEKVELKIENKRENNYLLPSYIGELENYYFAENENLYINQRQVDEKNKFMWYFPENRRQVYNYNITNLHPISTTEMAVFFKDEIRYITYDSNVGNYRDIKTRLDIGCKPGSDVITTYDSKYTLFTTERGLVAMSYQEFISSTEQALSYLSDNIYEMFTKYIENGQVKLHKYGFWIFVYRQDRKEGYLFDLRTNSWWPIQCINNVQKLYNYDGKLFVLSKNTVLKPDTSDVDYYDLVNKLSTIIPWRIRSQKLYLGAANYNKLVFNMTFASIHDLELLESANIPITETTFKLQVQNYRKVITGDIGTESATVVNYNVNAARTFVQRMNYGNVNEFEYLLSYDDKAEYHIPLSLSSISIKYKIGGPVR